MKTNNIDKTKHFEGFYKYKQLPEKENEEMMEEI